MTNNTALNKLNPVWDATATTAPLPEPDGANTVSIQEVLAWAKNRRQEDWVKTVDQEYSHGLITADQHDYRRSLTHE